MMTSASKRADCVRIRSWPVLSSRHRAVPFAVNHDRHRADPECPTDQVG